MSIDIIRAELAAIENEHGRLTPEQVVAVAENPNSPLHEHFSWDDTEAARRFRLGQARQLIRSVKVEITVDHRTISTVHYVHDPEAEGQGYVSVPQLQTEDENALAVMRLEVSRIIGCIARAEKLAQVLSLETELAKVGQYVDELREVLELRTRSPIEGEVQERAV